MQTQTMKTRQMATEYSIFILQFPRLKQQTLFSAILDETEKLQN